MDEKKLFLDASEAEKYNLSDEKWANLNLTMEARRNSGKEDAQIETDKVKTQSKKNRRRPHIGRLLVVGAAGAAIIAGGKTAVTGTKSITANDGVNLEYADKLEEENDKYLNLSKEERDKFISFIKNVEAYESEKITDEDLENKVKDYVETDLKSTTEKILTQKIIDLAEADASILRTTVSYDYNESKDRYVVTLSGQSWHGAIEEDVTYNVTNVPDFMEDAIEYIVNDSKSENTIETALKMADANLNVMYTENMVMKDKIIKVIDSKQYEKEMMYKERQKNMRNIDVEAYHEQDIKQYDKEDENYLEIGD